LSGIAKGRGAGLFVGDGSITEKPNKKNRLWVRDALRCPMSKCLLKHNASFKRRNFPHTTALLVRSCCQFIESGSQHFDEAAVQLRHGSFDKGTMRPGFIVLLFALSHAQEGYLGSGHDKWHQSFYRMLQRPDGKGSCCNLTDCRPTSGRTVDGHYEVKVNGAWVSVPQTKIIRQAAPDGGYHVCAPYNFKGQPEELYCVIL